MIILSVQAHEILVSLKDDQISKPL